MNDEIDNVINAEKRFSHKGGVETKSQREQDREYGKAALKALKKCTKLPQKDREQIARQLGFRMRISKVDSSLLAKRSGFEPKENYRLVLKQGEEAVPYRLRPKGEKYAALIENLAILANPKIDVFTLASRITRGTSVHPSADMANSEIEKLTNLIYLLVDGIDDKFRISEKFATIAQMKESLDKKDPWAYWPSYQTPEDIAWSLKHRPTETSNTSFWLPELSKQTEKGILVFEFENIHWEKVIGYLPHFFLGHQKNFAWDHFYWPSPEELWQQGKETKETEEWYEQIPDKMFEILGGNPKITTTWDMKNDRLLFNGEPSDIYRKRIYDFQKQIQVANDPGNWSEGDGSPPLDTPAFFWLCIYPNADATGVVPVLLSTNWEYGSGNTVELIDEHKLSNMSDYPVLGDETLGSRLRKALLLQDSHKPALQTEWLRTARFIDQHPLLHQHQEYHATERHIMKWREQILRDTSDNSEQNEDKT